MSKYWNKYKVYFFLGIAILLLSLILRIYNLILLPVFADEAIYIRWSQVMRSEQTLRFLPLSDGKQPLFMWVTIPFLKLFSDPLFAGRLVSVFSGVGTTIGVFVLSQMFFRSLKVSLVAGFFYALSPFAVFFDRLALADSLLTFFGIWTLILLVISVRYLRLDSAMLAGFSLGGALLTKSPAIYFAIMAPLSLILARAFGKKVNKALYFAKLIGLLAVVFGISFAIYNILRLGPEFHMIAIRNSDYVYPFGHLLSSPFDPLLPFLHRIWEYYWQLGPFLLVLMAITGAVFVFLKYPRETTFLAVWSLLPIFASAEFSKTMTARYVLFSLPYFVVLASSVFLYLDSKAKKEFKLTSVSLLLLFAVISLNANLRFLFNPEKSNLPRSERSGYLEEWTAGHGIKEVAQFLRKEYYKEPDKKIVVGTEGYFGTLPDGLKIYLNDLVQITIIGVGQPVRELHPSLRESKRASNKTYLVVNDSRLLGDFQKISLRLISSYPKGIKPDSSYEKLLFFEVVGK